MDSGTIDLNRAERAVSSLLPNDNQQGYQPKTLNQHNKTRKNYLPIFPTKAFGPNDHLLLTNVPITRLAPLEITRRQHGAYTSDALEMMNNYKYSNYALFTLSEQDANELVARLRVHMSIITFNAVQLRGICYNLCAMHESFRQNVLHKKDVALKEPPFYSKQMAIVLEFFLQIDVDIFYMKTCSFGGAELCPTSEGLFCEKNEAQARYTLQSCDNLFCLCCHPQNSWRKSQPWPVVDFVSSSMHQFVNGYTTYLNCPATCNTSNIIYTMTCPCGEYDYVDSTADTLADAMTYHREHGNRIIHEKLTGSPLRQLSPLDPIEREKRIINNMRLYRHSARCPKALRTFLDCNPQYWCFIPMPWYEAQTQNIIASRSSSANTTDPNMDNNMNFIGPINNQRVADYFDRVPVPPSVYAFTHRQRKQQRLFFQQLVSSSIHILPYSSIDLYKMAIIAVLHQDSSTIPRYIIETLFIIHGETKLNMICPLALGDDPEERYGRPYQYDWCHNLNNGPISTTTTP